MQVAAHPGALAHLAAYLRTEQLPVPAYLERYAARPMIAGNEVDAVSPSLIIRALEEIAIKTRRPDFGVDFAQWVNTRGFGPLSLLGEQCPTLRYAIEARRRYLGVINGAYNVDLQFFGNEVHIIHGVLPSYRPRAGQFLASVMVLMVRLIRRTLGSGWNPIRAEFGYARPPELRRHDQFFHCPLLFEAERFSVICVAADIDRPLPTYDPEMLAFVEQHLESLLAAWPRSLEEQVERLAAANLAAELANIENIANIMATNARTLQRKLAAQGTSFTTILNRVRRETVLTFFRETPHHPVIALAHLLGYSDASTVSRFIMEHFGMDSRALRNRLRIKNPSGVLPTALPDIYAAPAARKWDELDDLERS